MNWPIVTSSDIESLPSPLQFLEFSEAYLYSAEELCNLLCTFPKYSSYSKGSVILSLTFHGVELFLKAAILQKCATEQFRGLAGHDVESLVQRFAKLYPGKKYEFDLPFKSEPLDLSHLDPAVRKSTEATINKLKRQNPTDQLHRYPRNVEGESWKGCQAFEPHSFFKVISQLRGDIARLKDLIFYD